MLLRFGDVVFEMRNEKPVDVSVVVRTGPDDESYGAEVVSATPHGFVRHNLVNRSGHLVCFRRPEPESVEGVSARMSIRDWAETMVGIKFTPLKRIKYWIDQNLFGGRWITRRLSTKMQTEEGLMMSLVLFRNVSMFKTVSDVFEHFNHRHSTWQRTDERRKA